MRATVAAILLLLNGTIILQLRILKSAVTKFHRLFVSPVIKMTLRYFIHKHHVAVNCFEHLYYPRGPYFSPRPGGSLLICSTWFFETLDRNISADKKTQLDVTFCILYFSSNSCSTCFGQPCAHHQELTTA